MRKFEVVYLILNPFEVTSRDTSEVSLGGFSADSQACCCIYKKEKKKKKKKPNNRVVSRGEVTPNGGGPGPV
jgi:hypothetical protein